MSRRQKIQLSRTLAVVVCLALAGRLASAITNVDLDQGLTFNTNYTGDGAETIPAKSGNTNSGQMTINGGSNKGTVVLTFPSTGTVKNGANSISVTGIVSSAGASGSSVTLSNKGVATYYMGGTLGAISAGAASGLYSGSVSVVATEGTSSATATLDMSVTVYQSVALTVTRNLLFGNSFQGEAARTIAATDGDSAQISVTGEPNRTYTVTVPGSGISLSDGAGNTITVNTFTSTGSGTLSAGGTAVVGVGGKRAAIGASKAAGYYSGTFTVSVVEN